jgi:nucleotide-binding universal stress UspA family protein
MRALVWIVEDTWEATVDEAADLMPADAEITLLHVAGADAEAVAGGARNGLLGRRRGDPAVPYRELAGAAAAALLEDARGRLGRDARLLAVHGRVEREVVAAAEDCDLLVLARDGDHDRLGPHSLAPPARFVVDHAPCRVLLVWPDAPPPVETIPPHKPKPKPKAKPKPKPKPAP